MTQNFEELVKSMLTQASCATCADLPKCYCEDFIDGDDVTDSEGDKISYSRFMLFAFDKDKDLFILKLKPNLTAEEKELLKHFLKALLLTFDEFKLKLNGLNISVKNFMSSLKENLLFFKIPSPQYGDGFLKLLIKKNLLPKALLEKLDTKPSVEQENRQIFRPTPFSTKLKPKGSLN